ncbi:MAG TPA: RodZ domain-containing protein [Desulfatiglandales bacterium]|nr:RodZ domain-containing protein [Desulfatiglandales bacterium]
MVSPKISGVGSLLKREREKRGLSLDQLSQITRLRKHYLEALEDEKWEDLPSPVYVKGFIRSFAQGLGIDAKEAISLYEHIAPAEEEVPKPLKVLKEPKSKIAYLIIPLIAVLVFGIYILVDLKDVFPPDLPSKGQEGKALKPVSEQEMYIADQGQQSGPEQSQTNNGIQDIAVEKAVIVQPATPPEPVVDDSALSTLPSNGLVLTGIVNMMTYIKIYADDNPPKEYIFKPDSRPQWFAREGFYLVVGNAAGIEFDFNGKRTTGLGPVGKVIRISFPEDFKPEIYGN